MKRKIIASLFTMLIATMLLITSSNAATSNVKCDYDLIAAAVAAAKDGDIINIAAGSASFDAIITTSRAITIQGAGDTTVISGHGFKFNGTGKWRLAYMKLTGGAGVTVNGSAKGWRIHHIYFDTNTGDPFRVILIQPSGSSTAYTTGVIDNCTFYHPACSIQINGNDQLYGNEVWERPLGLGGVDAIYIEDCTFDDSLTPGWVIDSHGGSFVFRHNTLYNAGLGMHDAIVRTWRGCRKWEVYDNEFNNSISVYAGLAFRGGTGVAFNNRWNGVPSGGCIRTATYRKHDTGGTPWDHLCDGGAGKAIFSLTHCPSACTSGNDCINIDGSGAAGYP